MSLSNRIRNALSMTQMQPSGVSNSLSDTEDSSDNSPTHSPIKYRQRTLTINSSSSTSSISIIQAPVLCLKKTFSDLRGAVKRRKEERYREAVALWAQADEREWEYPTWGGPAKKSRKYSREQRDSLRSWGWEKSQPSTSLECRSRHSSMYGISPGTSPNNSFSHSHISFDNAFEAAGRLESTCKPSSRAERPGTIY
ncbi:hypothetical protein EV44_g1325 [Erysiphe necator]|uniref:Uncharacterized protein n=1 Tax=Uncinula necator TaxID=52586 RepID=A0A0B1P455_UNCNE|nr:hypothetical protein EV44_g1325 [Erysiphe necator]